MRPELQATSEAAVNELRNLALCFHAATAAGAQKDDRLFFTEVREHMASAGRQLIRLVSLGTVPVPHPAPPWLSWSLRRFGRRPHFDGVDVWVRTAGWWKRSWEPKVGVRGLINAIDGLRLSFDKVPHRPREHEPAPYRHRHVFLEAVTGWLGRSVGVQSPLRTPIAHVFLHIPVGPPGPSLELCLDWADKGPAATKLWFLELSRACAQVCSGLADATQQPNVNTLPVTPDAQAGPNADAKQLIGWKEILPVLGFNPKDRNGREKVNKLNEETKGPIRRRGKRSVIANHGLLLSWWKTADRAAAAGQSSAAADRDAQVSKESLSNRGVRKDEGFHVKQKPNTRPAK
jgi:hypothetical protein